MWNQKNAPKNSNIRGLKNDKHRTCLSTTAVEAVKSKKNVLSFFPARGQDKHTLRKTQPANLLRSSQFSNTLQVPSVPQFWAWAELGPCHCLSIFHCCLGVGCLAGQQAAAILGLELSWDGTKQWDCWAKMVWLFQRAIVLQPIGNLLTGLWPEYLKRVCYVAKSRYPCHPWKSSC